MSISANEALVLPANRKQKIGLDHRNRRSKANQHRRSETRRMPLSFPVKASNRAGDHRQEQTKRYIAQSWVQGHRHLALEFEFGLMMLDALLKCLPDR